MTALICGSLAFDNIMVFPGRFREHILPDRIHMLNVAFMVPEMRREFGGCAGNIAFNLHGIGGAALPMGTVGQDFDAYQQWLDAKGIDTRYLRRIDDRFTAQAYITTDLDDNQITAFHPGAMEQSHLNKVPTDAGVSIGIIAPDGRDGMIEHARQFAEAEIPFIFDPGQGLPMFEDAQLRDFLDMASWVTVNDYEAGLLQQKTGLAPAEIAERVRALVITRGGEGSVIWVGDRRLDIPAVRPAALVDPTGCGDAYRAGLLHGLMHEADWEITGRLASLLGAMKIASPGTQNHSVSRELVASEFRAAFDSDLGF
ncbi:MAG: carbohydrate kinase family protein [Gammaproteobacteria bacterium]|nr:carbohydrate kinase family protein [Gammaproteobacteria bacterium]